MNFKSKEPNMEIPLQDDFKWFGEGFNGFPKRLPDDTVEYFVYVVDAESNSTQKRSQLAAIQKAANEVNRNLLKDYIWQRESFQLELRWDDSKWSRVLET